MGYAISWNGTPWNSEHHQMFIQQPIYSKTSVINTGILLLLESLLQDGIKKKEDRYTLFQSEAPLSGKKHQLEVLDQHTCMVFLMPITKKIWTKSIVLNW